MKLVYLFSEGNANMREILGGKGANLAEMTNLGLPVPQGFTVSTTACVEYMKKNVLSEDVKKQINKSLASLEKISGKKFGDASNPLLVSVRSGARVSMPGMLDTILNLGLNDEIVEGFAKKSGNPVFAHDCYRRFIQMYGNVVQGIADSVFEKEIEKVKKARKIKLDQELNLDDLKLIIKNFKNVYKSKTKQNFPQDVKQLLFECVESVFKSWNNDRAKVYRKLNNIPQEWGTAVNVQMMVFGNYNQKSGTGVCFSRNPSNGVNEFYGEYLMNAQGEDIVAGVRTPSQISSLKKEMPKVYKELYGYAKKLEKVYKDMQDMEFTIFDGKLYILQTRNGKRNSIANNKMLIDFVKEKLIDVKTALKRVEVEKITDFLHATLTVNKEQPIAKGIPASPGGAVGKIVFNAQTAKKLAESGEKVILVRMETSAEDIEGMTISQGILTARGGMTSHAAVVARGMGRVCICGCDDLEINGNTVQIGNNKFKQGDYISLDGTGGSVYKGKLSISEDAKSKEFETILSWAKQNSKIGVFANADTPEDAKKAVSLSAEGIGLCRTEHMFFKNDRIIEMRKMILSKDKLARKKSLAELLKFQKEDFGRIFKQMNGKHTTIRLLDPPLHEFMPKTEEDCIKLAKAMGVNKEELMQRIDELKEVNPMMGHRGLRLAVSYPEIYEMQVKAIIQSALEVKRKENIKVYPDIMIPLTSDTNEFLFIKNKVIETVNKCDPNKTIKVQIGTMIETPRACVLAEELASVCDFFSFGTNDLTQFTYGFSRDDSGKFLNHYYKNKIFEDDVFAHIDQKGVGKLMIDAIKKARKVNKEIKIGVCGEHGGDIKSIEFFKKCGVNYVSCSVMRLPVARLTAI